MSDVRKTVLITGANSGIGFEVARQLLQDPSYHVLLGARSMEKGTAAVEKLHALNYPGQVEYLILDVADEESVCAAAKAVQEKHGGIDVLVNNAGIASSADATEAEQMVACFRVNAVGPALMGDYFVPLLKKSKNPRLVYVTTGGASLSNRMNPSGFMNSRKVLPYRASKAAMHMVFAGQWNELHPDVLMFLYGPGFTESNLGPANRVEHGAKPVEEGAAPIVAMIRGERDEDSGKFIEYGVGVFPW